MDIIPVAVVQAEVAPSLASALDHTENLVREAAKSGAKLVVFPETWIPGYPVWLDVCRDAALWDHDPVKQVFRRMASQSIVVEGESGQRLAQIASDAQVTLVIGVSERVEQGPKQGTLFNTLLTFGPNGSLLNHHRKLIPTYTERIVWGYGDGNGLKPVSTPAGRVGGMVCWEHWMPLARQAMHEGGEDIHVAVWPTVHETHQLASRQYAFEGRCYVLAAGSLMKTSALPPELEAHPEKIKESDKWLLRGGSAIIGPDAQYICKPLYDESQILYAELELERLREEKMTLDVSGHYHRPDVFDFQVHHNRR